MRYPVLVLLFTAGAWMPAASPWTTGDTIMEAVSEAGLAGEWAQMVSPPPGRPGIHGVDAELLGARPSRASLNRYFAAWALAHPLLAWELPKPWRLRFQSATIAFEFVVDRRNATVGCRIHF
jgi:hypothetical protein